MGKKLAGRTTTATGPDHLTMRIFSPGMTALHRVGLGGLACTLRYIERARDRGMLFDDAVPGGPWDDDQPPWEIDEQSLTLRFGEPTNAAEYLQRLFKIAFQIKDGLIYLPGQYLTEPNQAVRADLQAGLTLSFLQHGKTRNLAKDPTIAQHDPEGAGVPGVVVEYRRCQSFKHQELWKELLDTNQCLTTAARKIEGPISPGSVVRHVAFTGSTAAQETPERLLPLYFSLIGCLALPVNRGVAALLIPEVDDLLAFMVSRPFMTPTSVRECQITNIADAALQAQIRLRHKQAIRSHGLPGCDGMTFMPTPWASQQKSRVATMRVPPGEDMRLDRFEIALASLSPRIVTRTVSTSTGRGKNKIVAERMESFRADSIVRPLIAENLALGRPWYSGFIKLATKTNPATDKPYRNQLPFERKGLHDMISNPKMWDQEGESLVVQAVHEATRQALGRIREDTDGKKATGLSQATKKRWERFREKLRIDLAGAKTAAHVRFALVNLFSRGGSNKILQNGWAKVLPVIRTDWQLARDLGLLALASYAGRGDPDTSASGSESTNS